MTQPLPFSELSLVPESRSKPLSNRGLRFLCRLGQGGMAEVHLANAAPPNTSPNLVVVKRMHQQHVDEPSSVRMFLDEARLALCLSHPNIVRTERLSMFDGRHGIVMEFLEGQPLHQVLKRAYETEATLSLEVIAQIAIAALDGLHYAHELKGSDGEHLAIVHRDVSPQNLFLTYDGAVKLLDFGIAKNALQDGRTRTGLLKGKVSYMAPEQARGEELDRRADLWSLGVVLWEAVTGSRLFKGSNEAATLNMTLTDDVAAPSLRRPDLPPELERILMRALKRSPAERYATAADMRDELETWLNERELLPSASVSQLMKRLFDREMREQRQQIQGFVHAQPDPSAESGVTLVAPLLGGGTFSGLRGTQVSSVTDLMQELTRQRRVTTRLLSGLLVLVGLAMVVGLYLMLERPTGVGPGLAPFPAPLRQAAASGASSTATSSVTPVVARVQPDKSERALAAAGPARPLSPGSARNVKPTHHGEPTFDVDAALASATPAPQVETGSLNLDTTPWSIVTLGGRVLGQTPLVGVTLPAGTHTLQLSNPEQGLKTTYQVTINAGRVTARRIGLD